MPLIDANGKNLYCDITGPEGAPAVVFAHSVGASLEMWDAQVRQLADRYRCVRYDARGHGRSDTVDTPIAIHDLADDLASLLNGLAIEEAHIVGLSLGGMTAQAFALRYPERVLSLTLMATASHLPPPKMWQDRAALIREQGMAAIVDGTMVPRWFTPAFAASHPAAVAATRDRFLKTDPIGYAVCCEVIAALDLRNDVSAITARTLVIAGDQDPATPPSMLQDLAQRIKGAQLVIVSAAHLLAIEAAAHVNESLGSFLAGTPRSSFESGLANRKSVLGAEHVERSLAGAGSFAMPFQDFITRAAWGEVWGDPTLPWKTRSMLTLTMMVALHREEEFKLHLRPALKNGVTLDELRALLIQSAIYAGVPAANAGFRWVKDVLGDELERG